MKNMENPNDFEREVPLNLKGPLKSFIDSPLAPLIEDALEKAGIEPWKYDLKDYGHINFYGLPATEPGSYGEKDMELSPIVKAIYEKMEEGSLISKRPEKGTVQIMPYQPFEKSFDNAPSNAQLLSDLLNINLEGLHDAETGEVVAYSVPTSSHGGRPGHVIISTNDVESIKTSE